MRPAAMRLMVAVVAVANLAHVVQARCEGGWVESYTSGQYCYRYFGAHYHFYDAQRTCRRYGAKLASINNWNEAWFVQRLCRNGWCRIGLNDISSEGRWVNDGGNDDAPNPGFRAWSRGEPNNWANEDTVHFWGGARWNDIRRWYGMPFVCKKRPICPAGHIHTGKGSRCSSCPVGQYTSSKSSCSKCPAGRFGSARARPNALCSGSCSLGYYCPAGSSSSRQAACPAGRYGASAALRSASQCAKCPSGISCPAASTIHTVISRMQVRVGVLAKTTTQLGLRADGFAKRAAAERSAAGQSGGQLTRARSVYTKLKTKVDDLRSRVAELSRKAEAVKASLDSETNRLKAQVEQADGELKIMLAKQQPLTSSLEKSTAEYRDLADKLRAVGEETARHVATAKEVQADVERLEGLYETKKQQAEETIAGLKATNKDMESRIQPLVDTAKRVRAEGEAKTVAATKAKAETDTATRQMEASTRGLEHQRNEVTTLQSELRDMVRKRDEESSDHHDALVDMDSKRTTLRGEVKMLTGEADRAAATRAEEEAARKKLTTEADASKASMDDDLRQRSFAMARLQGQVEVEREEASDAGKEAAEKRARVQRVQQQIADTEAARTRTLSDANELEPVRAKAVGEAQGLVQHTQVLSEEAADLGGRVQEQLVAVKHKRRQLNAMHQQLLLGPASPPPVVVVQQTPAPAPLYNQRPPVEPSTLGQ